MPRKVKPLLEATRLGPIRSASIEFADLTVFIGPQAAGKSILLQTLKLIVDHRAVAATLRKYGYEWKGDSALLLNRYYGEGMGGVWNASTTVRWKDRLVTPASVSPNRVQSKPKDSVFYIPAHRVVIFKNGWPRHFGDYGMGDPYIVEDFSETTRQLMESGLGGEEGVIFPQSGRLTAATRDLLRDGIFGHYELRLDTTNNQKRLVLQRGRRPPLPFMVWSAGQREFGPMLLGLYHLMPSGGAARRSGIKWAVIEEPEMGLHPKAISAVLFLVLELMSRGYRVCLSTHSPQVLDLVWAVRVLAEHRAGPDRLLDLFEVKSSPKNRKLAEQVLRKKDFAVYYFDRGDRARSVRDISTLNPSSPSRAESSWGGLTQFSSRAADVVADVVANS